MAYVFVSQACDELAAMGVACTPKRLSDLIYLRRVDVRKCPLSCGRRMIPRDLLPTIAQLLRRRDRKEAND